MSQELKYSRVTFREMYEALESWEELWGMRPLDSGEDTQAILRRCWAKTEAALTKAEGKEAQ